MSHDDAQHISSELLCLQVKWQAERERYLIPIRGGEREPNRAAVVGYTIAVPVTLVIGLLAIAGKIAGLDQKVGIGLLAIPIAMAYWAVREWWNLRDFTAARTKYEEECTRLQRRLDSTMHSYTNGPL